MLARKNRLILGVVVIALLLGLPILKLSGPEQAQELVHSDGSSSAPSSGDENAVGPSGAVAEEPLPSSEDLSLEIPGPPRADIVRGGRLPEPLGEPLASRLENSLEAALAGDGQLAGELAMALRNCRHFERLVSETEASISVAQSLGDRESEIRAHEDQLLRLVEKNPARVFCKGVAEESYDFIDRLSRIAVQQGNLGELPTFIAEGMSNERMRRYLADPAAREEFRSTVMPALDRGIRHCHAGSAVILARFHEEGIFAPQDPTLALAYYLMATWINGFDPERAPPVQEQLQGLSSAQIARGVRYARSLYNTNCR